MIVRGKIKKLRNPVAFAGFVGVGNVGKITIEYLIDSLEPEKLLEIYGEFLPNYVIVNEDFVGELPKIEFFVLRKKRRDYVFVTSDVQPFSEFKSYKFSKTIFDVLVELGVKEIVTAGGLGVGKEPEEPRVYGVVTKKSLINKFKKYGVIFQEGRVERIVGGAGLLIGFANIFNIRGISLLAETLMAPFYLGFKGARSIINILSKVYSLKVDISGLEKEIEEYKKMLEIQKEEMKKQKIVEGIERKRNLSYFR